MLSLILHRGDAMETYEIILKVTQKIENAFEEIYKRLFQRIEYPPSKTLGGDYLNGPVIVEPEVTAPKPYIIKETVRKIVEPYPVNEVITTEESAIINLSDPNVAQKILATINEDPYRDKLQAEVIKFKKMSDEIPGMDPDLVLESGVGT